MDFWEPYISDDWPQTQPDTEGREFDWFCLDQAGHVGVFCSAGSGPVPEAVFQGGVERYNELLAFLSAREQLGAELVFNGRENYQDWERYAKYGLYAFDFQDVHRSSAKKRHGYDLIYRPKQPLMASELPEDLRAALLVVGVVFGEGNLVPTEQLSSR